MTKPKVTPVREQQQLDLQGEANADGPVECLGMTFENDKARRAYFTEQLRQKLEDPEFRRTPGFPKGEVEGILRLSDPPYYTACPNPFLQDLLAERTSPEISEPTTHEPFAFDVAEGKQDPVCMAHTYHTKVPYRAITRYILHYTRPGDVVLDSFAGTGMTGLAAQQCESPSGELRAALDAEWKTADAGEPAWGRRFALLFDLSPFATFLCRNFTSPLSEGVFELEASTLIDEVERKLGWVYDADSPDARAAQIQYVLWAEPFYCECGSDILFWRPAGSGDYVPPAASVLDCPRCGAEVTKRSATRATTTFVDTLLGCTVSQNRQIPLLVEARDGRSAFRRMPTSFDLALIDKVDRIQPSEYVPTQPMLFREGSWGDMHRSGHHFGVTHAHQFWTRRNLLVLSELFAAARRAAHPSELTFLCTSFAVKTGSRMHNVGFKKGSINLAGQIYNTLALPSVSAERNLFVLGRGKINDVKHVFTLSKRRDDVVISTASAAHLAGVPDHSIDYVFIDPPFGDNIMYSELSFLYEAWLGVFTDAEQEAIVSGSQRKSLSEYQGLMVLAFQELFRALKPGRWMTVAFHNSKNVVWNAIQEALGQAGFVVADVRTLDKGQGTYKQMTTSGAVKQDLVISAYKPSQGFAAEFRLKAGTADAAWQFIRERLQYLPTFSGVLGAAEPIVERQAFLLFDRMVAFHVRHSVGVPMDAAEFYEGLSQRFPERDGMYFLSDQVAEYDRKRTAVGELRQLTLFVTDEASAIQWLRQQLHKKPQTFQELQPQFMRELQSWAKHERTVELREMLEQNFLHYDGKSEVPSQIHAYLSSNFKDLRNRDKDDSDLQDKAKDRWYVPDPGKQVDLEKLRDKALLREFEDYKTSTQRKLKQFRTEALRAGFKAAYDAQDYKCIVDVAKKIPENVLQEDEKLLMYYDVASMRLGEE